VLDNVKAELNVSNLAIAEFAMTVVFAIIAVVGFAYTLHDFYTLSHHYPLAPHSPWVLRNLGAAVICIVATVGAVIAGFLLEHETGRLNRELTSRSPAPQLDPAMEAASTPLDQRANYSTEQVPGRLTMWLALSWRRRMFAMLSLIVRVGAAVLAANILGSNFQVLSPFHPLVYPLLGVGVLMATKSNAHGLVWQWRAGTRERHSPESAS
jgi:hypothetical protein